MNNLITSHLICVLVSSQTSFELKLKSESWQISRLVIFLYCTLILFTVIQSHLLPWEFKFWDHDARIKRWFYWKHVADHRNLLVSVIHVITEWYWKLYYLQDVKVWTAAVCLTRQWIAWSAWADRNRFGPGSKSVNFVCTWLFSVTTKLCPASIQNI